MDDRYEIWGAARRHAESGGRAALVTVCRRRGSLPMASDAKMFVAADGTRLGTVGGGCVEADVAAQALDAAEQAVPAIVTHTHTAESAGDIGLSCGGTADFFLEPVVSFPEMAELYGRVAQAIRDRVPVAVYTAADWSGGPAKALEYSAGGPERHAGGEAREGLKVGRIEQLPSAETGLKPGQVTLFDEGAGVLVEFISRMPRVVIFGAGYVGLEIAKVASGAGFYVVAIDDREEFANPERIPWAQEVVAEDFRTALDRLTFDEDDYVLATTRGHNFDAYIVERTAGSRARYVGMLGSKRKRVVIGRALEAAGVPGHQLARVKTPIGLDIGADTPAEIAVSVVAELVKVRRRGERAQ